MSNFSFRIFLDKRYKSRDPLKKGQYPVKIRVASKITKQYKQFNTGIYIDELIFYSLFPEFTPKDIKKKAIYIEKSGVIAREKNNQLLKKQIEAELDLYKNAETHGVMTLNQLKNNLGVNNTSISFKDWVNNLAKNYENKSELDILRSCYLSLTAYHNGLKSSRTLSIMIKKDAPYNELSLFDFNKKFLNNWEAWMLNQNLSLSTIGTYAKYLDFVISEAVSKGAFPKNSKPIGSNKGQYEIKVNNDRINRYLYDVDRVKFKNYKPENYIEQLACDLWNFSYYSLGLNLVDIYNMKLAQVSEDRSSFWFYRTKNKNKKTQNKVHIEMNDFMRGMMDKYKGSGQHVFNFIDNYKSHRILNSKISKAFNDIADKLEIDNLCYQMARHSAFTNLSKDFSTDQLLDLGTHAKKTTLEGYIKKIEKTRKEKSAKMFNSLNDD